MANNVLPVSTYVLKVDLKPSPMKVLESLKKIIGVYAIKIKTQKGLVIVAGIVDPKILIRTIEKIGGKAKLYVPMHDKKKLDHKLYNMQTGARGKRNHQNGDDSSSDSDDDDQSHYNVPYMRSMPLGPNGNISWHHPHYSIGKKLGFGPFGRGNVAPRVFGNYPRPPPGFARPQYGTPYMNGHYPPVPPLDHGTRLPLPYMDCHYGNGQYRPMIYDKPPPPPINGMRPPLPLINGSRPPPPPPNNGSRPPPPPNNGSKPPPLPEVPMFHGFSDENIKSCTIM